MAHINEAGVKKINEICDRYAGEKTPPDDDPQRHPERVWIHSFGSPAARFQENRHLRG